MRYVASMRSCWLAVIQVKLAYLGNLINSDEYFGVLRFSFNWFVCCFVFFFFMNKRYKKKYSMARNIVGLSLK